MGDANQRNTPEDYHQRRPPPPQNQLFESRVVDSFSMIAPCRFRLEFTSRKHHQQFLAIVIILWFTKTDPLSLWINVARVRKDYLRKSRVILSWHPTQNNTQCAMQIHTKMGYHLEEWYCGGLQTNKTSEGEEQQDIQHRLDTHIWR